MDFQQQQEYVLGQLGWTHTGGDRHPFIKIWIDPDGKGFSANNTGTIARSMIHDLLMEEKEVECYSSICEDGIIIDTKALKCAECNGTGKVKERVRDKFLFIKALRDLLQEGHNSFTDGLLDEINLIFATPDQLIEAFCRAYNPDWSD